MAMEWDVLCKDTLTGEVVKACFGTKTDPTYLNWLLNAWGWTVGVALTALVVALVVGSIVGVMRTLPDSPWLVRFGNAWVELFRNIPLLVNRIMAFIEKRVRVPGFVASGTGGGH